MERRIAIPRVIDPKHLDRPGGNARPFSFGGETMGTTWSVRFFAPEDFVPGFLLAQIDALLARITRQMSLWEQGSDISRFNRAAGGAWVDLPEPFFSVLSLARELAEETGGAFDPTLGALAECWGFGPAPAAALPGADEVMSLRGRAGWRRLELDAAYRRVLQPGGLTLDLNAIAKGDSVDRLGALLDEAGLRVWLAEIGGELRARGRKPDGDPWWVRLETGPDATDTLQTISPGMREAHVRGPEHPSSPPEIVVALSGHAVATSGAYRRTRQADGRTLCHAINPATGAAMGTELQAVTVLAETCARADALATALFVMGTERGATFAAEHGIAALFSGNGGEILTPALEDMLS